MSFDPQDCLEMPILASEHIEKLETENKALKEGVDDLLDAASNFLLRVSELTPHIRYDRVVALNHGIKRTYGDWVAEKKILWNAIKIAETIKKKESK